MVAHISRVVNMKEHLLLCGDIRTLFVEDRVVFDRLV